MMAYAGVWCGFPSPSGSGASIRAYGPVDYARSARCGLAASRGEPSSLGTGYRLPNEPGVTLRSPPSVNCRPFRASDGGRAEQVIDVSVRRSGEESGTHRTHGTVADGTKGHAGSPLYTSYISARWRSTDMCPCDAACKTMRLVENYMQYFTCFASAAKQR